MDLLTKIKTARETATLAKDSKTKAVLTLLLGEVERVNSKGATDAEVFEVSKAMAKRINETKEFLVEAGRDTVEQDFELSVLADYRQTFASEEDTKAVVASAVEALGATGMKDMGKVMGKVKQTPNLDMGLVSKLVKEALQ